MSRAILYGLSMWSSAILNLYFLCVFFSVKQVEQQPDHINTPWKCPASTWLVLLCLFQPLTCWYDLWPLRQCPPPPPPPSPLSNRAGLDHQQPLSISSMLLVWRCHHVLRASVPATLPEADGKQMEETCFNHCMLLSAGSKRPWTFNRGSV